MQSRVLIDPVFGCFPKLNSSSEQESSSERVKHILEWIPTLKNEKFQNVSAYYLIQNRPLDKKVLNEAKLGSKSGIWRTGRSINNGFKPAPSRRREQLNDEDKSESDRKILDILQQDAIVYTSQVAELV